MSSIITFDDIVNIGKRRVNDTITVEVPALGGSVKIRQISGAEQDAAVAIGYAAKDGFDQHAVAREQIKAALVEPALPEDEADEIIDGLPIQAFGQLQAIVQSHSGLMPGVTVEGVVAMFRSAAGASDEAGAGTDGDHGSDALDGDGLGSADTDAGDEVESVLPVEGAGAADGSEEGGEAAGAPTEDGEVTA